MVTTDEDEQVNRSPLLHPHGTVTTRSRPLHRRGRPRAALDPRSVQPGSGGMTMSAQPTKRPRSPNNADERVKRWLLHRQAHWRTIMAIALSVDRQ